MEYVATRPQHLQGQTMTQLANQVEWTPELRSQLQNDHRNFPQVNACSRSPFSSTGQGQVEGALDQSATVQYPTVDREYAPPPRPCEVPPPEINKWGGYKKGFGGSRQRLSDYRRNSGWGNSRSEGSRRPYYY